MFFFFAEETGLHGFFTVRAPLKGVHIAGHALDSETATKKERALCAAEPPKLRAPPQSTPRDANSPAHRAGTSKGGVEVTKTALLCDANRRREYRQENTHKHTHTHVERLAESIGKHTKSKEVGVVVV